MFSKKIVHLLFFQVVDIGMGQTITFISTLCRLNPLIDRHLICTSCTAYLLWRSPQWPVEMSPDLLYSHQLLQLGLNKKLPMI